MLKCNLFNLLIGNLSLKFKKVDGLFVKEVFIYL